MKLIYSNTFLFLSFAHANQLNNLPQIVPNTTRPFPTRELAGLTVISTPIVFAAESYARSVASDAAYAHIMRSWLYGVLAIQSHPDLYSDVDLEVHAVGALLHDLGWDRDRESEIVSKNRRFEVDGAFAASEFIRNHADSAEWSDVRVQRVWDAIALHTEQSIVPYKELDVRAIPVGITMDFVGPAAGNVTEEAYAEIGRVFPKDDFFGMINETMIWLCRSKPQTTVDTWIQPFGEEYVGGYKAQGKRAFDIILSKLWP